MHFIQTITTHREAVGEVVVHTTLSLVLDDDDGVGFLVEWGCEKHDFAFEVMDAKSDSPLTFLQSKRVFLGAGTWLEAQACWFAFAKHQGLISALQSGDDGGGQLVPVVPVR